MVETFTTNIRDRQQASVVIGLLQTVFRDLTLSFHQHGRYLQLRVENEVISDNILNRIIDEVTSCGFFCALPWKEPDEQQGATTI